ncbi:MAG TPA: hypothetical protein PKX05_02145 [bacterium]|nr:hypothetical protein [bacterium]
MLTVAIGTGLIIIAANLNVMQKSNETLLASAIAQYHIESLNLIDFPPVYFDRQTDYPKKISEDESLINPSFQVPSPDPNIKVYMGCVWYGPNGGELSDNDTDLVVLRKVKIEVRRAKDNYLLIKMPVFITRNGVY